MFTQPVPQWGCDMNLGLILGAKHNFIIDTGFGSGSVKPIMEYIDDDKKPIIVINTHSHWDHLWGNWVFENCPIIAHKLCREILEEHWDASVRELSDFIDGEVHKCLPNVTFEGNMYFPDDGIELFHSPGHSANSISVYDAVDKMLYAGDEIGDTDEEIIPKINTDMATMQSTIALFKQYDFDICISGHNKPQKKDVLGRMDAALQEAWEKQSK